MVRFPRTSASRALKRCSTSSFFAASTCCRGAEGEKREKKKSDSTDKGNYLPSLSYSTQRSCLLSVSFVTWHLHIHMLEEEAERLTVLRDGERVDFGGVSLSKS